MLPQAAAARRIAAVTSRAPLRPSSGSGSASTPTGSPIRTASLGLLAGGRGGGACRFAANFVGLFALPLRTGLVAGFGFAAGCGAGRIVREGVTAATTGRGRIDGVAAAGEESGVGDEAVLGATCVVVAIVGAEATTSGASGVGIAWADSAALFGASREVGADGFDAADVVNPPGGSSGAGIGVPPAARLVAGHASAAMQTPTTTESRVSRRDDVHVGTTTSLPFGVSRYVGRRTRVNTLEQSGRRVSGGRSASVHQRFFFGIPPWIAWDHAPPRWSSHEPCPATCRESEP